MEIPVDDRWAKVDRTHELARKRTGVVSVLCDKSDLGELFFFVPSVRFSFPIHSKLGSASLWVSRSAPTALPGTRVSPHGRENPVSLADVEGMVSVLLKTIQSDMFNYLESVRLADQLGR